MVCREFTGNGNEKTKNNNKTKVTMKKLFYLGPSILDISKKVMYEYWHDYAEPKLRGAKLCQRDADML